MVHALKVVERIHREGVRHSGVDVVMRNGIVILLRKLQRNQVILIKLK